MPASVGARLETVLGQAVSDIAPLPGGSVNRVWRLTLADGTRCILRLAPGAAATAGSPTWLTHTGLRQEQFAIAQLGHLAQLLPHTLHFEPATSTTDGDWIVQGIVPGQPAAAILPVLGDAARRDLMGQIGELAASIHQVRGATFGDQARGDAFPTWTDLVRHDSAGFRADYHHWSLDAAPLDQLDTLLEAHHAELDAVPPSLIHSDLSLHHVFVTEASGVWTISGLIDLEFARFADPVSEGLLLAMLDRADADAHAFFTGYGPNFAPSAARITIARLLQDAWLATDRARLGIT